MVKPGEYVDFAFQLHEKIKNKEVPPVTTEMSIILELAARLAAVEEENKKLKERLDKLEGKVG